MSTGLSPEMMDRWAKRIAVEIDPDREALAPMMLKAYMRGGRDRKQLFECAPTLGGVLPDGGASLLPYAFLALGWVATGLTQLCSAGGLSVLSDLLSCGKNLLELVKIRKVQSEETGSSRGRDEMLSGLHHILEEVQQGLEKQGLPTEQCELVSYRVMKVLLQEPAEAAQLVQGFQPAKG
jgi:hypothetical protein